VRRRPRDVPAGERDAHEHDVPALRVGEHVVVGQVDPSIHRSAGHGGERARREGGQPLAAVAARRQRREWQVPLATDRSQAPRTCPRAETSGLLRTELRSLSGCSRNRQRRAPCLVKRAPSTEVRRL
jgi:hypothetical protein